MKQTTLSSAPRVPADVPELFKDLYTARYERITHKSNHLFLFAADQKIEHLNEDFQGTHIHADTLDPEHLFRIANAGFVGAFATQLGLISRYCIDYEKIPYIAKLNGKTNLDAQSGRDPESRMLWSVHDVQDLIDNTEIDICGIGYTVYLGGSHEAQMLSEAAQAIHQAHAVGLLAIVWVYPRATHLAHTDTPELLTGAAGIGAALGADFVKIHAPQTKNIPALAAAATAAGRTGVICSGGAQVKIDTLLHTIHEQLHIGHMNGCAIGRNIFQRSLPEAIALTQAINAMVYKNASAEEAMSFLSK